MKWTITSLLDWTTLYFTKHNIDNPHLEAEILLAHTLNIKRLALYMQFERELKEEELAAFKTLMLRRAKKEPTAYIVGTKGFMSMDFEVSPSVLIPRPETEHIIEAASDIAKEMNKESLSILDIGTGSGALAVSLAKYIANSKITAIDISKEALRTAEKNAKNNKLSDRIEFIESDHFSNLGANKFDIIVSNPPYIPTAEIAKLQDEIVKYEPMLALDGGEDGLDHYRSILASAKEHMKDNAHIIFEVGIGQAGTVSDMLISNGFSKPRIYRDLAGIDRVLVSKKLSS